MWDGQYAFEKSKIIQGDCLEKMKLIPDGSIDMILADLPYGTTACKWDTIIPFEPLWEQYKRVIKDNGAIVLTASQPFTSALIMSNLKMFKYEWIWEKSKASNYLHCKYQPMKAHENVLVFSKYPAAQNTAKKNMIYLPQFAYGEPYDRGVCSNVNNVVEGGRKTKVSVSSKDGKRYPRSVQYFRTAEFEGMKVSAQKPVALFEYLIKTYTNERDIVLDNVAGSGTTGEACINLNRDFILIEKEPNYYEVIKERVGKIFKNYGLDLQPLLDERM